MIQASLHIEESISPFFIEMGKVSNDLLNHALQEGGAITAKIANRKLIAICEWISKFHD